MGVTRFLGIINHDFELPRQRAIEESGDQPQNRFTALTIERTDKRSISP
jgi:hypothetical protein